MIDYSKPNLKIIRLHKSRNAFKNVKTEPKMRRKSILFENKQQQTKKRKVHKKRKTCSVQTEKIKMENSWYFCYFFELLFLLLKNNKSRR